MTPVGRGRRLSDRRQMSVERADQLNERNQVYANGALATKYVQAMDSVGGVEEFERLQSDPATLKSPAGRALPNVMQHQLGEYLKNHTAIQLQNAGANKRASIVQVFDGCNNVPKLAKCLGVNPHTAKSYLRKSDKDELAFHQRTQSRKMRSNVRRDKVPPIEIAAMIWHAKHSGYMAVPSGSPTDVYALTTSMRTLYNKYRADFATVLDHVQAEFKERKGSRSSSNDDTFNDADDAPNRKTSTSGLQFNLQLRNKNTISGVTSIIEPDSEQLTSLRKFVHSRKRAGLSTMVACEVVVNDGGRLVLVARGAETHADSNKDLPQLNLLRAQELHKLLEVAGLDWPDISRLREELYEVESQLKPKAQCRDHEKDLEELEQQRRRSQDYNDQLRPRSYKAWKKALRKHPETFRWRGVRMPHSCPLCAEAPFAYMNYKDMLKRVYDMDAKIINVAEFEKLSRADKEARYHNPARLALLEKTLVLYRDCVRMERHSRQYANQRPFIKSLEETLPRWSDTEKKIVVYEDFVAQYNYLGKKVQNLVFTIKWRDKEGNLQFRYIDNICSDKTQKADCMYVLTCWKFLLRGAELRKRLADDGARAPSEPGLSDPEKEEIRKELAEIGVAKSDEFEGVTHIVRTGDNGAHLLNKILLEFESSVMTTHGIHWVTHTLCKRHGYNLCDAHGGCIKRHVNAASVQGYNVHSEVDFCYLVSNLIATTELNAPRHANCKAYAVKNVPRMEKAELEASQRSCNGMQDCCEFEFTVLDDNGEPVSVPGCMRTRTLSGQASEIYQVFDIKRRGLQFGTICNWCSVTKQRPMYHKRDIITGMPTCCEKKNRNGDRGSHIPPWQNLSASDAPDALGSNSYPKKDRNQFFLMHKVKTPGPVPKKTPGPIPKNRKKTKAKAAESSSDEAEAESKSKKGKASKPESEAKGKRDTTKAKGSEVKKMKGASKNAAESTTSRMTRSKTKEANDSKAASGAGAKKPKLPTRRRKSKSEEEASADETGSSSPGSFNSSGESGRSEVTTTSEDDEHPKKGKRKAEAIDPAEEDPAVPIMIERRAICAKNQAEWESIKKRTTSQPKT